MDFGRKKDKVFPLRYGKWIIHIKKDSISGCVKLLDTRGIFDELAFIGNGDSAFVAFAVAYTIDEKNGNSSFLEKVFTPR